jgi:outer membrane protein
MRNLFRQYTQSGPHRSFFPGASTGGRARAILFLLICLLFVASAAGASQIVIRLDNPPPEGTIVVFLYDSPSAFADFRDPVVERPFRINGGSSFRIENVSPGEYAMILYYDENGNGRLDRNFIGIPTEPVGLANRYQPKGPPGYDRASFVVADNEVKEIPVELWSPLGDWGSVGVGVGVIALSSPYRDYDGSIVQPIPAVTYIGERFQIFGPYAQVDIARIGGLHLAATAILRIGVYAEKDSPFLEGMGDRSTTLMGGLALRYNLPLGIDLSAGYQHDVLGRIGGGAANIKLEETLPLGFLRITPGVGVKWLGKSLSNHDFGVPAGKALEDRPAYRLGETFGIETGLGTFIEISRAWRLILDVGIEFLDGDIKASPIVGEGYVIQSFTALNYVF